MADTEADRLLREADRDAERTVSLLRIGIAATLLAAVFVIMDLSLVSGPQVVRQIAYARISLTLLLLAGLVAWIAIRVGLWRPWLAFLTVTFDCLVVITNLALGLDASGLSGDFIGAMPSLGTAPLVLAAGALRLRPGLQTYASGLMAALLVIVAVRSGFADIPERRAVAGATAFLYAEPANAIRALMLGIAAVLLVVAAARGRRLLRRAVDETTQRLTLGRFLPRELTPLIAAGRLDSLRQGHRASVALLFVDIRDSTALAETLEPGALAALISTFREHVTGSVERHGGVIDKFVGDGAFVVFGLPHPAPDDCGRALGCAGDIVECVSRWNEDRRRLDQASVRVGVGVHCGEVFVGVVGHETRLEFAVLGEAVNVASRIEQATKVHGGPILVSREILAAAGVDAGEWRLVAEQPPRGATRPLAIYAPPSRSGPRS